MHQWKITVGELGIIEELLYNNYCQRIVAKIYYGEIIAEKLPLPTKTYGRWVIAGNDYSCTGEKFPLECYTPSKI
jgi:hypothetical protein